MMGEMERDDDYDDGSEQRDTVHYLYLRLPASLCHHNIIEPDIPMKCECVLSSLLDISIPLVLLLFLLVLPLFFLFSSSSSFKAVTLHH